MVTRRGKPSAPQATTPRGFRRRRFARWLLRIGAGVFLAVVVLVVAVLTSGGLRAKILAAAWQRAESSLPGAVSVGRFEWPELGHLRLTDVVWHESADLTVRLAAADRLEVWLDLGALRAKDVRVDSLHFVVPWIDGPLITDFLSAQTETRPDTAATTGSGEMAFPRPGVIPDLPSVAVSRWRLDVARARLTTEATASAVVATGGLEAGHGRRGRAFVDHLEGQLATVANDSLNRAPVEILLHHLGLGLTLAADRDSTTSLDTFAAVIDSLTLHFDAVSGVLDSTGTVLLKNRGRLSRSDGVFQGALLSDFLLPGAATFAAHLPAGFPAAEYDQIRGRLALAGTFAGSRLDLNSDLDLTPTPWLDRGHLRAHVVADSTHWSGGKWQDAAVVIDTLDFALLGAGLRGSGTSRAGHLDLGLQAALSDPRLVALFQPDLPASATADLDLEARVGGTWQRPTADVNLTGGIDLPQARVPRLSLRASGDLSRGDLVLNLPAGLALADASLDSLAAQMQITRAGSDSLFGDFTIAARQGADRLAFGGSVELSRRAGVYRGAYATEFVLPGAGEFRSLLPPDFPYEEYGPVVGKLALSGAYEPSQLDVTVDLDLAPTPWIDAGRLRAKLAGNPDELVQGRYDGATIALDTMILNLPSAELQLSGTLRQNDLNLSLRANVTDARIAALWLPELEPDSELSLALDTRMTGTLTQPTLTLDLQGRADGPGLRVPELSLRVDGDATGAEASLHLPAGLTLAEVSLDSLAVQVQAARAGIDSLNGAFALAVRRGPERMVLGGRAWSGAPGRLTDKQVRLDSLIILSPGRQMRLHEPTTIALGPGPLDITVTPLLFSGEPGEIRLGGQANATELDLRGGVDLLLSGGLMDRLAPSDIWSADGGHDLSLIADAELKGTRAAPGLDGHLTARLVPRTAATDLGLEVDFALTGEDTTGLRADLALTAADTVLIGGHFSLPGQMDARTGQWRHLPGRPARIVVPEQKLNTSLFSRLLPSEVAVRGSVTVGADITAPSFADSASGDGSQQPGSVAGLIRAAKLEVDLPNSSRMVLGTDLKIDGTVKEPRVSGRVVVASGFFRVPEIRRNLHPVQGNAMLWSLAAADTAAGAAVPVVLGGAGVPADRPPSLPDLALDIHLPGNLRVYGYGLDVEMAGDLQVSRGYDRDNLPRPKIQGALNSVQGTLRFMNREFTIERSEIRFRGALPADPELDMLLQTTVSGTIVRITVTGQATNPVIALSSTPDYEEADIMAVLLFGQTLGDLDTEQRGNAGGEDSASQQLRQNLAGLAMAFGTSGLQNSVSSTVGVDMVELGADSEGDSTLMVGKFINPSLMLKYHHSLEKSGTYFLTMEYALSRLFKLVSTYGQGSESSGLELRWSRRY